MCINFKKMVYPPAQKAKFKPRRLQNSGLAALVEEIEGLSKALSRNVDRLKFIALPHDQCRGYELES
jgi:hypothetical protein